MALVGRQQQIVLNTGDYGTPTTKALLWLPDDYNTSGKSYPLIISCPGIGEQGTDIKLLITQYQLAGRIASGWNPVGSDGTEFIVLSTQGPKGSWGWNAPHLSNFLAQIKSQYRIDNSRVFITGLSAGVWAEWKQLNDKAFSDQIAAICCISETTPDDLKWMDAAGKKGTPVWFVCGTADDKISVHNTIYNYYKGPKIKTDLPGIGHTAWHQVYNPTWTDKASGNKNLYDWFLSTVNANEQLPIEPNSTPMQTDPTEVTSPVEDKKIIDWWLLKNKDVIFLRANGETFTLSNIDRVDYFIDLDQWQVRYRNKSANTIIQ